ncbi:putative transcription-repair coupling factor [Mycobacterium xenopi 4042]|uniref:Putative transcription-repair coupling factor n=1 Tax=Mycobacterium xenopi 4042 TaxID=1299334 RepID=X8AEH3_MYCXE|nr:putative transcription-repair coupling factor [Mycobacterium xenopi 4042]
MRLSPMTLPDSAQVRLVRLHPGARYRATTSTVQVPIPRAGGVARREFVTSNWCRWWPICYPRSMESRRQKLV